MAVRDWDPTPYPDPRRERSGPGIGEAGLLAYPPTPRIFAGGFYLSPAVDQRWLVSPRFRGPGLVRSITMLAAPADTAGQVSSMMFRYGPDGGGQGDYAVGARGAEGLDIIEMPPDPAFGNWGTLHPAGISLHTPGMASTPYMVFLNYLVTISEWYLKVGYWNNANGTLQAKFVASIYEGIDPNTIVDLMSGT